MSTTVSSTVSSATPSPSDSSNRGNNNVPNGLLGSTGGAPLILVFLGAGLLVGAVFALLILRRFYPRRRREAALAAFRRRDDGIFDEKPLLWDVQLEIQGDGKKDSSMYTNASWDDLSPMSARFIPDNKIPPPAPLPLITLDSIDSESDTTPSGRLSGLRRHLPFGRSNTPTPSVSTHNSSSSFESPTGGYSRNGTLQVAVAIGMPKPPSQRQARQVRGTEPEFCLGLTELPWDERVVAKTATS